MSKNIKLTGLADAIQQELTIYREEVVEAIDALGAKAVKDLVKETQTSAPKRSGSFRRNIASKVLRKDKNGSTYVWYVKAPFHRVTHLLVHGHATKNGGRTKADPFLKNAVDRVLPEYEKAVEEALKNG